MSNDIDYFSRLADVIKKFVEIIENVIQKGDSGLNEIAKRHRKKKIVKIVCLFDRLYPKQVPLPDAIERYVSKPTAGNWYEAVHLIHRLSATILKLSDELERLSNGILFEYRDELRPLLLSVDARKELFDRLVEIGVPNEVVTDARAFRQAMTWNLRLSQLAIDKERKQSDPEEFPERDAEIERAIEREGIRDLIKIGEESFPRPTGEDQLLFLKKIAIDYRKVIEASDYLLRRLSRKIGHNDIGEASREIDELE